MGKRKDPFWGSVAALDERRWGLYTNGGVGFHQLTAINSGKRKNSVHKQSLSFWISFVFCFLARDRDSVSEGGAKRWRILHAVSVQGWMQGSNPQNGEIMT